MNAADVVGYVFEADIHCPDHIAGALTGETVAGSDAESYLDRIALARNINRSDESSYDSGEFPKVVFASDVTEYTICGTCFCSLLDN